MFPFNVTHQVLTPAPVLSIEEQNNLIAIPWLNKLKVGDFVDILHPSGNQIHSI